MQQNDGNSRSKKKNHEIKLTSNNGKEIKKTDNGYTDKKETKIAKPTVTTDQKEDALEQYVHAHNTGSKKSGIGYCKKCKLCLNKKSKSSNRKSIQLCKRDCNQCPIEHYHME